MKCFSVYARCVAQNLGSHPRPHKLPAITATSTEGRVWGIIVAGNFEGDPHLCFLVGYLERGRYMYTRMRLKQHAVDKKNRCSYTTIECFNIFSINIIFVIECFDIF